MNFVEAIDVELSHERRDVFVPKKGWQDLVLNFLRTPDEDLAAFVGPRDVVEKLFFLN